VNRELVVLLNGVPAGVVRQDSGELSFIYEEAWRNRGDSYPLSLSMPLVQREHGDPVVRSYMEGLLPDNESILQEWGRRFGVSARNPFSLLQHVGEDVAGAAQFVDPERLEEVMQAAGEIEWLDEAEIASRLEGLLDDHSAWRRSGDPGHFSLAGAQPKTALYRRGNRWGVPSGAIPTTHIIKPPAIGLDHFAENEHLCLRLARQLEISASNSEICRFEDQPAIVVERYDREELDGRIFRIHQEDLCQSAGITPRTKYEAEGGPGVAPIVELLHDNSSAAAEDIYRFIEALALNWVIGAPDAHAKNYSVLIAAGQVRLAPLYDLVSLLPYPEEALPRNIKLAMKVGGEYRVGYVMRRHWLRLAEDSGLDPDRVVARVLEVASSAADAVHIVVAAEVSLGVNPEFGQRFEAAVAANAQNCLAAIGAGRDHSRP
jgi:serine/threonine-protein kinase HipA